MSTSLSVLYLSFNEQDVIEKSLESVRSIADEIVVIPAPPIQRWRLLRVQEQKCFIVN